MKKSDAKHKEEYLRLIKLTFSDLSSETMLNMSVKAKSNEEIGEEEMLVFKVLLKGLWNEEDLLCCFEAFTSYEIDKFLLKLEYIYNLWIEEDLLAKQNLLEKEVQNIFVASFLSSLKKVLEER